MGKIKRKIVVYLFPHLIHMHLQNQSEEPKTQQFLELAIRKSGSFTGESVVQRTLMENRDKENRVSILCLDGKLLLHKCSTRALREKEFKELSIYPYLIHIYKSAHVRTPPTPTSINYK